MGLFFSSDRVTRPGPGVRPDAPRKKGVARLAEIMGRDMWNFFRAGFLAFLGCLPFIIGMFFAVETHALLFMLLEIIKTPAIKISRNRTTATERRVCPMELPSKSPIEKLPCLPTNRACSIRKPISVILNTAVTINTANTMQSSVIRFCRR